MGPCDNKLAVLYLCVICPQLTQVRRNIRGTVGICPHLILVQRNDYETDPYFLKNFQSNRTVCVIVRVENMVVNLKLFKKKSKQKMTQDSKQKQFQVHNHVRNSYKTRKSTLLCIQKKRQICLAFIQLYNDHPQSHQEGQIIVTIYFCPYLI